MTTAPVICPPPLHHSYWAPGLAPYSTSFEAAPPQAATVRLRHMSLKREREPYDEAWPNTDYDCLTCSQDMKEERHYSISEGSPSTSDQLRPRIDQDRPKSERVRYSENPYSYNPNSTFIFNNYE